MAKSKARQALEFVQREAKRSATATDLHNAFFGNGGEFGKLFPTRESRDAFMRSPEYQEIVEIRDALESTKQRATA